MGHRVLQKVTGFAVSLTDSPPVGMDAQGPTLPAFLHVGFSKRAAIWGPGRPKTPGRGHRLVGLGSVHPPLSQTFWWQVSVLFLCFPLFYPV